MKNGMSLSLNNMQCRESIFSISTQSCLLKNSRRYVYNLQGIESFETHLALCGNAPCAITLSLDNYSLLRSIYKIILLDFRSHLKSN